MTLVLPDWYQGGCPDIEKDVLRPLFQPLLPNTHVVSWIPKPDVYQAELLAGKSYLRTYRTGGRWNDEENRDEPVVQFAALCATRADSWQLIEFVRQVLICFIRQTGVVTPTMPGTDVKLSAEGEVAGPQLIPELLQDDKLVPIAFQFFTWKPKGLPDYRAALEIDL